MLVHTRHMRTPITNLLLELWRDLLALLWPTACVVCNAPDRDLCADCAQQLRELPCELPKDRAIAAQHTDGAPLFAAGTYEGPTRALLIAYKHAGAYGFVRPLGRRLAAVIVKAYEAAADPHAQPVLIVTVPSRRSRVRKRGFRHVDALVREALREARPLGMRVERLRALRPLPGRTGQVGLDTASREQNARLIAVTRGAARKIRGRTVILVDDIVTSGATTRAACEALEHAGATVKAVVAICAVPHKNARAETQVESHS